MGSVVRVDESSSIESRSAPLLDHNRSPLKTPAQKAVRKAFKGTAHLSNLLPTGSVLTFQILSPVVTQNGECRSFLRQILAVGFLAFCGISCFLLCFTDSFRDERGKVRYGVATFRGLKVIDGSPCALSPEEKSKFRVRFVDFIHAGMSIMVFAAVAVLDKNVRRCLWSSASEEARVVLAALPVVVGAMCSVMFVLLPSRRHGIGFPLSRH
ncbi:protein DMP7-like [Andrographis paniculata]|uniref:protein DMP7-like n=1 Tax=Andrographis paniculata TaxID=175694 RepID=UPI0021E90D20|nr:protein DMP7-like [Andrographis paniculata]